tara:strand:- start:615 stop:800 length:186 start_codon:yes stop_codon:yes gene_type:complete
MDRKNILSENFLSDLKKIMDFYKKIKKDRDLSKDKDALKALKDFEKSVDSYSDFVKSFRKK